MQQHATIKERKLEEGRFDDDIEVIKRETFENLKAQVEAEEKLQKEQKRKKMVIEEEETSRQMHINEVLDSKAQVRYGSTMSRESAEQVTFSSCKETTEKDETNESRTANATPRE